MEPSLWPVNAERIELYGLIHDQRRPCGESTVLDLMVAMEMMRMIGAADPVGEYAIQRMIDGEIGNGQKRPAAKN